jgi:hypothetical protein
MKSRGHSLSRRPASFPERLQDLLGDRREFRDTQAGAIDLAAANKYRAGLFVSRPAKTKQIHPIIPRETSPKNHQ